MYPYTSFAQSGPYKIEDVLEVYFYNVSLKTDILVTVTDLQFKTNNDYSVYVLSNIICHTEMMEE